MPGTNGGTGQPNWFCCSVCRRDRWRKPGQGSPSDVKLTGRTKDTKRGGYRVNAIAREYKCNSCQHVGWSRHNDLDRKAARA